MLCSNISPNMSLQYGELRPTSGWDLFVTLGHPQQISTGFASWQHYCTAKLRRWNTGRHPYSTGRPSRWALAHISSSVYYFATFSCDKKFHVVLWAPRSTSWQRHCHERTQQNRTDLADVACIWLQHAQHWSQTVFAWNYCKKYRDIILPCLWVYTLGPNTN